MSFRSAILAVALVVQPEVVSARRATGLELMTQSHDGARFNVMKVAPGAMKFSVRQGRPAHADFYINSNFFHKGGRQIGEIVIDGVTLNSPIKGGSYFFVKGGVPGISADVHPSGAEFSTQSVTSVIDDGVVWRALLGTDNSRAKVARSMIGKDRFENIYVISTTYASSATLGQITEFAMDKGVVEAMVPDGGTSVDYKMSDGSKAVWVKVMPGFLKYLREVDEPQIYIVGNITSN